MPRGFGIKGRSLGYCGIGNILGGAPSTCATPGRKIRSKGKGRGLGKGKGRGPIGGMGYGSFGGRSYLGVGNIFGGR